MPKSPATLREALTTQQAHRAFFVPVSTADMKRSSTSAVLTSGNAQTGPCHQLPSTSRLSSHRQEGSSPSHQGSAFLWPAWISCQHARQGHPLVLVTWRTGNWCQHHLPEYKTATALLNSTYKTNSFQDPLAPEKLRAPMLTCTTTIERTKKRYKLCYCRAILFVQYKVHQNVESKFCPFNHNLWRLHL